MEPYKGGVSDIVVTPSEPVPLSEIPGVGITEEAGLSGDEDLGRLVV